MRVDFYRSFLICSFHLCIVSLEYTFFFDEVKREKEEEGRNVERERERDER